MSYAAVDPPPNAGAVYELCDRKISLSENDALGDEPRPSASAVRAAR
jgi:hypothetical protein